jgi:hypothetical protein
MNSALVFAAALLAGASAQAPAGCCMGQVFQLSTSMEYCNANGEVTQRESFGAWRAWLARVVLAGGPTRQCGRCARSGPE